MERSHCRSLRGCLFLVLLLLQQVFYICTAAQCRSRGNRLRPNPQNSKHLSPFPAPRRPSRPRGKRATRPSPPSPAVHVRSRDNSRRGLGAPPPPSAARALRPPSSRVLVPAAAAARLFSPLRASRLQEEAERRRRRLGRRRAPAGRAPASGAGAVRRRPGGGLGYRRTESPGPTPPGEGERGACRRWGL